MPAPREILTLVEQFKRKREELKASRYKEASLRVEFLDPFLETLGWDVRNTQGHAEAFKEVIHEDAIRIGDAMKAPDYCMRIGHDRKFFVEAKKPSVDIKGAPGPAYQLRRYAWSAKLPLSILTDFEEFAVYDCRSRPKRTDKASVARIHLFTFEEYAARWDEIAAIFSKNAVLKGSFDKYASEKRRGTQEVDDEFLKEIEHWRELLAKNIANRNPSLGQQEMNYAVQQTIDRMIFLRICEDRGIEQYGRLMAEMSGSDTYERLKQLFHDADGRYNSGLFHFREEKGQGEPPDTVTPHLAIDDTVLKEIIASLYDGPYAFAVIPPDILGHVYEQFLGKVIRLTEGHHAKVEEKPEVRKAGGVYYTPKYIVDYIVEHTVGKLLAGKTPKQVAELKIVDPACGSGSFLLGAYQYLLDWHLKYYLEHDPKKWKKELCSISARHGEPVEPDVRAHDKGYRLSISERKRILLSTIFGVDIDPQAVEVTKLSLLLKVLEGETGQTAQQQLSGMRERVLPDLGANIKCGNSLIGSDFHSGEQQELFGASEEDRQRINAFDWEPAFPQVFKRVNPGFDAVIGNPPYIRIQAMKEWAPIEVEYYKKRYVSASKGNYDIYVVFVEKGLSLLNKDGLLGFILPHKFFNAKYGESLREILAKGKHVDHIVHFGDKQVFEGATTYTCLLFLSKTPQENCNYVQVTDLTLWRTPKKGLHISERLPAKRITKDEWNLAVGAGSDLFYKLQKYPTKLGDIADIFVGLQTSADTVFLFKQYAEEGKKMRVFSKELNREVVVERDLLKPVIRSGSIDRFAAVPTAMVFFPYQKSDRKFELIPEKQFAQRFPLAWQYLLENRRLLTERENGKFSGNGWYQLYPKNLDCWERPKIMLPYMITKLAAYFDENNYYFVNVTTGGFGISIDKELGSMKYFTGLLNSKLLDWYLKHISSHFHGGYFAANKQYLVQLPIRLLELNVNNEKKLHDQMVNLVDRTSERWKKYSALKTMTVHEKELWMREVNALQKQIDQLAYGLYGLTEEEISIVEQQT